MLPPGDTATILETRPPTMPDQNGLSRRALWAGGEPIANLLMARTLAHPEIVSLAAGFVDQQTLPLEPTRQALDVIWSDPKRAQAGLQYGTTIGYRPLREAVLQRMLSADGRTEDELNLSVDRVVITAGSNQFLFLVADMLLDPGDVVICGAPSYFVFLGLLDSLGACARGVQTDEHGLIPEAVDAELARLDASGELGRVKAIYVASYYDNPTGVTVPADRRALLVEISQGWSRDSRIYLIEDAASGALRYHAEDVPSMRSFDPDGETVIHTGTFSKSFSPGIRVGWGILPPRLLEPVLAQKGHVDFGSPNLNQLLMATVMELGAYDGHLEQLRAGYREKIDTVLAAADEFLGGIDAVEWFRPTGGLYVWLRLPEGVDTGLNGPLFDRAVEEGVLYVPGEYCYPHDPQPPTKNMLRLSFGIPSCEDTYRGMEALARAVRRVL